MASSVWTRTSDDASGELGPFYYPSSPLKLALLSPATFNFYLLWWFWSQWRTEGPEEGRGWALLKTVFTAFFFYGMARQAREQAETLGIRCRYSPAVLTVLLVADGLAMRFTDVGSLLALAATGTIIVPVQVAINRVHAATTRRVPGRWRWWELAIAVVMGLFWSLALIAIALSPAATE